MPMSDFCRTFENSPSQFTGEYSLLGKTVIQKMKRMN